MLGRDTAEFGRVRGAGRLRAAELQPLRECRLGLRAYTPLLRVFFANAETFVDLYKHLQSLVPEARPDTPVRLHRTPRVSAVVETTLQETLGAETQVLVIADPSELPRAFHSIDVLAERIGESAYRCEAVPTSASTHSPADAAAQPPCPPPEGKPPAPALVPPFTTRGDVWAPFPFGG